MLICRLLVIRTQQTPIVHIPHSHIHPPSKSHPTPPLFTSIIYSPTLSDMYSVSLTGLLYHESYQRSWESLHQHPSNRNINLEDTGVTNAGSIPNDSPKTRRGPLPVWKGHFQYSVLLPEPTWELWHTHGLSDPNLNHYLYLVLKCPLLKTGTSQCKELMVQVVVLTTGTWRWMCL